VDDDDGGKEEGGLPCMESANITFVRARMGWKEKEDNYLI
jgi:hypothetical protein